MTEIEQLRTRLQRAEEALRKIIKNPWRANDYQAATILAREALTHPDPEGTSGEGAG